MFIDALTNELVPQFVRQMSIFAGFQLWNRLINSYLQTSNVFQASSKSKMGRKLAQKLKFVFGVRLLRLVPVPGSTCR
jgi:hypothetical protein